MAEKRKLLNEIDKCYKKIDEGFEIFDDIMEKMNEANSENQREKFQDDLKKEIKKLQRLRDQIKGWQNSSEIKDKDSLSKFRKLIEQRMEIFKDVERENKTKPHSKQGLSAEDKLDPREKEKCETIEWLNCQMRRIQDEIDRTESKLETLSSVADTNRKRGGKKDDVKKNEKEKAEELRKHLERVKFHLLNLEVCMRMINNEKLEIKDVLGKLKEPLEMYIDALDPENDDDPESLDPEDIYEELNFGTYLSQLGSIITTASVDDEKALLLNDNGCSLSPQISINKDKQQLMNVSSPTAGAAASTPETTTAASGGTPTTAANASTATASSVTSSSTHTHEEVFLFNGTTAPSTPLTTGTTTHSADNKMVPPPPPFSAGPSSSSIVNKPRHSTTTSKSFAWVTASAEQHGSAASEQQPAPLPHSLPTKEELVLVQPVSQSDSLEHEDIDEESSNFGTSYVSSVHGGGMTTTPTTTTTSVDEEKSGGGGGRNDNGGGCSISPQSSLLAKDKQQHQQQLQQQLNMLPSPAVVAAACAAAAATYAPPETGDGGCSATTTSASAATAVPTTMASMHEEVFLFNGTESPQPKSREPQETVIPPWLGASPLGMIALNDDLNYQLQMLDATMTRCPVQMDSEKTRSYLPKMPCQTPPYYPQAPLPNADSLEYYLRLSVEALFFTFYYMEGSRAQLLAAKALKKLSWRFHTKYLMWFQRHEEPKQITDDFEQGTYVYFDFEKWVQRKKEQFTFEYKYLEDKDFE